MDEKQVQELRELALKNHLDPEKLLAIATADNLPEDLRDVVAMVMGHVHTFGRAVTELKKKGP